MNTATTSSTAIKKPIISTLPAALLRIEALVIFAAAIAFYRINGGGWGLFFALLLLPDVVFIPYMIHRRAGVIAYNVVHAYILPVALGVTGYATGAQWAILGAAIWAAHVAMDRVVGYGLKYGAQFKETHLNRI